MSAMEALAFDLDVAANQKYDAAVRRAAIEAVLPKTFLSGLTILPTPDVPETDEIFQQQIASYERTREVMAGILEPEKTSGDLQVAALEVKNFFDVFQEAVQEIATEARETNIPKGAGDGDDEGVTVRAALFWFPHFGHTDEACCCMPVDCCGCGIVVKEFRGIQLVWRPLRITRTIEPWTSRAQIIHKVVWVLVWVPVETIKTISVTCDKHGGHETVIKSQVVRDISLLTYWHSLVPCGTSCHHH